MVAAKAADVYAYRTFSQAMHNYECICSNVHIILSMDV
jgi:hypothetical protein